MCGAGGTGGQGADAVRTNPRPVSAWPRNRPAIDMDEQGLAGLVVSTRHAGTHLPLREFHVAAPPDQSPPPPTLLYARSSWRFVGSCCPACPAPASASKSTDPEIPAAALHASERSWQARCASASDCHTRNRHADSHRDGGSARASPRIQAGRAV